MKIEIEELEKLLKESFVEGLRAAERSDDDDKWKWENSEAYDYIQQLKNDELI